MRTKKISLILISGFIIVLFLLPAFWVLKTISPWSSTDEILEKFYQPDSNTVEDCISDILILNKQKMLPVICEKIKDKNMPHRRYAIYFLGNEQYVKAKQVLSQILSDETEKDYFRGDALIALYMIDNASEGTCAEKYCGRTDYLGHIAKLVLRNEPTQFPRRTFWDALFAVHR